MIFQFLQEGYPSCTPTTQVQKQGQEQDQKQVQELSSKPKNKTL